MPLPSSEGRFNSKICLFMSNLIIFILLSFVQSLELSFAGKVQSNSSLQDHHMVLTEPTRHFSPWSGTTPHNLVGHKFRKGSPRQAVADSCGINRAIRKTKELHNYPKNFQVSRLLLTGPLPWCSLSRRSLSPPSTSPSRASLHADWANHSTVISGDLYIWHG